MYTCGCIMSIKHLSCVNDVLIFANDIKEINMLQDIFQKNSVLNFTHELNKNNKISFLDALIDTNNNNNNFTASTYENPLITIRVPSTLKVNAPSDIKKKQLLLIQYPVQN